MASVEENPPEPRSFSVARVVGLVALAALMSWAGAVTLHVFQRINGVDIARDPAPKSGIGASPAFKNVKAALNDVNERTGIQAATDAVMETLFSFSPHEGDIQARIACQAPVNGTVRDICGQMTEDEKTRAFFTRAALAAGR